MSVSPKYLIAAGAITLATSVGAGVANAQPDLSAFVNTTCSYDQVVAALNAEAPALGQELAEFPMASSRLKQFLAAPVDQRQQMAQQAATQLPQYQAFLGGAANQQQNAAALTQVANTCHNY